MLLAVHLPQLLLGGPTSGAVKSTACRRAPGPRQSGVKRELCVRARARQIASRELWGRGLCQTIGALLHLSPSSDMHMVQ